MRRLSIYPLALVLALVTAVALLRFGEFLVAGPIRSGTTNDYGNRALVRGFYDAVNATLETGQSAAFDRLLAADLVVHGGPLGHPPNRTGFVQHLVSLHFAYPTMRLSPDVVARGDVVVADVRVEGATEGAFLNLPLTGQPSPWGTVDVFRIAAGAIVEYWGGQERAAVLELLQLASLDVPSSALQTLSLVRTTVPPGGSIDVRTIDGSEAISLETGELTMILAPGEPSQWMLSESLEVLPWIETRLKPGDLVLLPDGTRATIRNDAVGAATFLAIALHTPGSSGSKGATRAATPVAGKSAVTTIDLAGVSLVALPSGPAVLGLGRVTIAPGASFPVETPGATVFVVETGDLTLAEDHGTVRSRLAKEGTTTTATDGTRVRGDAITVGSGAGCTLRNPGNTPLVLLAVTITPVDPASTSGA